MSEHLPTPERARDLRDLTQLADEMYDRQESHRAFLKAFTKVELVRLWNVSDEHSWDDEVCDALATGHAYFEDAPASQDEVSELTETELIELSTSLPSAVSPLGHLAMDEYMRRRGEVIDQAIADRRDES